MIIIIFFSLIFSTLTLDQGGLWLAANIERIFMRLCCAAATPVSTQGSAKSFPCLGMTFLQHIPVIFRAYIYCSRPLGFVDSAAGGCSTEGMQLSSW